MFNKYERGVKRMSNDHHLSRVNKYKKRRSVKRSIITLSLLGIILLFGLIITFINGNDAKTAKDDAKPIEVSKDDQEEGTQNTDLQENDTEELGKENDNQKLETDEQERAETDEDIVDDKVDNESVEVKVVSSDDPNVIEAVEGNWHPIGTIQEEPHDVTFNKQSTDWEEMVRAIESVVKLDDMIIHWLGNGGEQKAIGTVSSSDKSEIYRVFISWIANEGWQPTRVEQLEKLEIIKKEQTQ